VGGDRLKKKQGAEARKKTGMQENFLKMVFCACLSSKHNSHMILQPEGTRIHN